jgi:anti-sigma B factor antagonist
MEYSHSEQNGILELRFSGDLIGENHGPELVSVAGSAIEKGIKNCVIDLSQVRYINSSGIGVLITLLTKFRNKDGEVVLIQPSENVHKLLVITKLTKIFKISKNKEEAIQYINSQI